MQLKLAFIGFGKVAQAFARVLTDHRSRLAHDYALEWKTTAIATANHGCVTSVDIDLLEAARFVEQGGQLARLRDSLTVSDALAVIETCKAEIVFETTPLSVLDGEPATTHIRKALNRGLHVVTANKGPIAFACSELKSLAADKGLSLRFEGTVMDGAPVFNLLEDCLPATRVLGFSGVLNSTTNLILTGMESGRSFEESVAEARRRGIAEANADYDIDGWDAAVKAAALANVLMDAGVPPGDVQREGIRNLQVEDVKAAANSRIAIRLVARGRRIGDVVRVTVAPEKVPLDSTLGSVRGTSNALILETDLMGEIAIVENDPGIEQTAYALLSDMIRIHNALVRDK